MNDEKLTLEWDGRVYSGWNIDDLIAKGVPQTAIDAAVLDVRKARVNTECKRRIYAVASPETQMNMATASAVISGKSASTRTDVEKAILAGVEGSLGWVAAMRGAAAALVADPAADVLEDAAWPACFEDVLAVVDLF